MATCESAKRETWERRVGPDKACVLRIITRLIIGGPTTHVLALHHGLDPNRFDTTLVTGKENPGECLVSEIDARELNRVFYVPEMVGQLGFSWRDLVAIAKLYTIMRRCRPHIVHTHTSKAGVLGRLAAWLAGVPVIVHTYHGHILRGYYGPITSRLLAFMERLLGHITTSLVAVSERVREELGDLGVAGRGRVVVIPLGLPLDELLGCEKHYGELRQELGVTANTGLVGIVGRIVPIKDHALFLEAAQRMTRTDPNVRFVVVGDGVLRGDVERRSCELGLKERVIFTGWRRDMARIYADMDVLVVSSKNEGTPVSVIEAMAAGKPVVATDVGGVRDLIINGVTGFIVAPGDAEAIAERVLRLLERKEVATMAGAAARVRARDFSVERLVRDVEQLYMSLWDQRSGVARALSGKRGATR